MKAVAKKKIKYLYVCILCVILIFATTFSVSASVQIPTESYTYWEDMSGEGSRKAVYSKPLFSVSKVIDSASVNSEPFSELNDVFVGENNIFLLDGKSSKILVLDKEYKLVKEYKTLVYNGEEIQFSGAKGVSAFGDLIYICDTERERVLAIDSDGIVKKEITRPQSAIIPNDFRYSPIEYAIDSQGYSYILCEGSYHGMLLISPEDEFISFFASNDVALGIGEALSNIWERVFPNTKKKSGSKSVLPYSIVGLCVDNKDFIYTVTGTTGELGQKGQIRKLYHGNGENILKAGNINFADEGYNTSKVAGALTQDLCSVDVDQNGYIYCLDATYGRIFMYDEMGTMLSAFGGGLGEGEQVGTYKSACSIAVSGKDILVCDKLKNTVTVYSPTELGSLISEGRKLALNGEYVPAIDIWKKVLSMDSNCQVAYSGLARAYLAQNDYQNALQMAKKGYDRATYSLAFSEIRSEWLSENFWLFFALLFLLIVGVATVLIVTTKRKIVSTNNKELQLFSSVLFHPIDTFTEIKEKNLGSIGLSVLAVSIFFIIKVLRSIYGGFLFTYYDVSEFNALWELARTVGIVVLWIAANWLVCSLREGNGKLREISIVVSYSLIPLILNDLIQLVLSNVLLNDEAAFLSIINTIAYIVFFLMLTFGSMIIHDYSFGKFLGTTVMTILAMAIVVFLIILIIILFQQFSGFVWTVFMEFSMK